MSDTDALFTIVMAGWATLSLSRAVTRLERIASTMERLAALAERRWR